MFGGSDALNINSLLRNYANELFISYSSLERTNIDNSFENLCKKLKNYFENAISKIEKFGSYTRGTILPRKYDSQSDIDTLIIFNQSTFARTPETYRNNLKSFAEKYYNRSSIKKDFPTVVVELNHIKFDLVPAKVGSGFLFFDDTVYIPDRENNWQETDPNGFNRKLTNANNNYGSIVKPIIRLLKYWNASHSYPYLSFDLEKKIADMVFYDISYQGAFFDAIDNLNTWFASQKIQSAVSVLKNNAKQVKHYLKNGNAQKAQLWLKRILPLK